MPSVVRWTIVLLLLAGVVVLGLVTDDQRILTIAIQVFMLSALASSWNILGGFAGQISLGHAVFFGLGALVTREMWLGGTSLVLSVTVAVVSTALVSAILGVPLLRFRGIYFAIGTLAVGVAVFLTIGNIRPGISSLPVDALREYTFTGPYYFTLAVLVVTVVVSIWLKQSRLGLGMMAVRDDEEAAGATGVGPLQHKLSAFVISAALAALAGASFAYFSVSYYPNFPFSVVWTFEAITVVFIGGLGTIAGPLVGSAFFVILRDTLPSGIQELQVVLFGVLFILVVLLLPGGLVEGGQRLLAALSRKGPAPPAQQRETAEKEEGKRL
ncbi:MAG TPA: branched-chain amino acid ABC transporter permease [Acidimicrobiia bacterium]|nr:branched-chain amino acid ABC transporter permease [Acidimicrobiia bacterium]